MKISATPCSFSTGMSAVGDDPAAEDEDVGPPARGELLDHAWEEREVRTGEKGEAHRIGVLLHHGLGDLLGRLVQTGVDDLETCVAERPRDDLRTPIVSVEAGLGDDDPIAAIHKTGTIGRCPPPAPNPATGRLARRPGKVAAR